MTDMMTFPNTVEEFMEQYKIVDTEKIYTNGAELVPIFRMMQWFEHVSAMDTISRQAAIDALHTWFRDGFDEDKWWNSTAYRFTQGRNQAHEKIVYHLHQFRLLHGIYERTVGG